jgi:hypothetical protein
MSARPIEVVLKSDIVESGLIRVAAGTEGVVTSAVLPPAMRQYTVAFTTTGSPIRTVAASQIRFRDGVIGPVRAILATTGGMFISDIDYTHLYSTTDLVIDNSLTYFGGSIKMTAEDGTTIVITSDSNGSIDMEVTFV